MPDALSTRHVHAVVAATVRVVRNQKETHQLQDRFQWYGMLWGGLFGSATWFRASDTLNGLTSFPRFGGCDHLICHYSTLFLHCASGGIISAQGLTVSPMVLLPVPSLILPQKRLQKQPNRI